MAEESRGEASDDRFAADGQEPVAEARHLQDSMKEFGVDTDRMLEATSDRVNDLQQMLIGEVQARPLRALAWAAAVGLVAGIMAAR